jgi:twitching motility protein PilT
MLNTPAIANMIREGKSHQIVSAIQTGRRDGMQLLEQHLAQLVEDGTITAETAFAVATHPSLVAATASRQPEPVA